MEGASVGMVKPVVDVSQIELLNCKWMEGLVKSLIRAVSALDICQCSQQFGQKEPGNQQSYKMGWWLEHLHGVLLWEVMLNLPIQCEMSLPFEGDFVGSRSSVCFSTSYTGFEQGWKLQMAVVCQTWALMCHWKVITWSQVALFQRNT